MLLLISIPLAQNTSRPQNNSPNDVLPMVTSTTPAPNCLFEPLYDAVILKALDLMFRMNYSASDSLLQTMPDVPARAYFQGLVGLNRFNDLGDTSALYLAQALWIKLDASTFNPSKKPEQVFLNDPSESLDLYQGLSELQLSYVAGLTGHPIKAATLGRKAISRLERHSENAEAKAAIALYRYYKAALVKKVDWVPFVHADLSTPFQSLERSIPQSHYLQEILQTSLLWLYYDQGRLDLGLTLIARFLSRYPQNRLYRQIQADFEFRKGDFSKALNHQVELNLEYEKMLQADSNGKYLPLGYLSSVGNLAKVYHSLNQTDLLQKQLRIWHEARYTKFMVWIPSSLKSEVAGLKK